VVYKVIKSKISEPASNHSASTRVSQLRGMVDESGNQAVATHGSAFSNPISEYGFTLLSAHHCLLIPNENITWSYMDRHLSKI